jgi:hypothetical protein
MSGTDHDTQSDSDDSLYQDCYPFIVNKVAPTLIVQLDHPLNKTEAEALILALKKEIAWWRYFFPYSALNIHCEQITDNLITVMNALQESSQIHASFKSIQIQTQQMPSDEHKLWLDNTAKVYHRPLQVQLKQKQVLNYNGKTPSRLGIKVLSRVFASLTVILLMPFLVGFYLLGRAIKTYLIYKQNKYNHLLDMVEETQQNHPSEFLFKHQHYTKEKLIAGHKESGMSDEMIAQLSKNFITTPQKYQAKCLSYQPDYNASNWFDYICYPKNFEPNTDGHYSYQDEQYLRRLYYTPKPCA